MFVIKKDYNNETKEILRTLNDVWYNFDKVIVALKQDDYNMLKLDNSNSDLVIILKTQQALLEIIHAFHDTCKSIELRYL